MAHRAFGMKKTFIEFKTRIDAFFKKNSNSTSRPNSKARFEIKMIPQKRVCMAVQINPKSAMQFSIMSICLRNNTNCCI